MAKKVILCILVIFVAWLLAVLLHDSGVDFYNKYYSFKRDLSFGIIIHFVFLYYFPATLVGSTLLFFFKRQLMLIPHLSLILYILYIGNYRPYRTLLILFSISIGYLLLWFSLKYIFTRKLNNQLPHSH